MTKEYTSEIVVGIIGLASAISAWFLGGRQKTKLSDRDSITNGADKIVDISNKLLESLENLLKQERQHRLDCEKSLREQQRQIDQLKSEINNLKKMMQ
jgi:chromosome segregation ATPase